MAIHLDPEKDFVRGVAEQMCVAARTAPKACGIDHLVIGLLTEQEDLERLADAVEAFGRKIEAPFFVRDAGNLRQAQACVLLGTRLRRMGIPGCNLCGFAGCAANEAAGARCAFNLGDLGIALGSAVSVAADHRVDCRIMYTLGRVAVEQGLLGPEVAVAHGIPLSATGKNPFFDRK